MTIKMKLLQVVLLLIFVETVYSYDLHSNVLQEEERWINLPSSPLIIEETQNKRFFLLSNISRERIVKYILGCVTKAPNGVRVICIKKEKTIDLMPQDPETKVSEKEILSIPDNELEQCMQFQAKIAIVEVVFADGSVWKANGLFSPCTKAK